MYVITRFRIEDYATWKVAFDDTVDVRIRHGAVGHQVFRSQDDENTLIVTLEFTSRGGAIGLTRDDASLLSAIRAAGIEGGPHDVKWQLDYVEQTDTADYKIWPYT